MAVSRALSELHCAPWVTPPAPCQRPLSTPPVNGILQSVMPAPELIETVWKTHRQAGELSLGFVSDLPVGPTTSLRYVEAALGLLARQEPDIILYGGDYLFRDPSGAEPLSRVLATSCHPLGAMRSSATTIRWLGSDRIERLLVDAGVRVLINRGTRITTPGGSLWLAGVDDLWAGQPDVAAAVAGRATDEPTLLLSHNPDIAPDAACHDVDLVLSGHTHGGQVRILGRMPLSNSRYGATYAAGWASVGSTDVYTSRGVGTVEAALRLGAPAELTLIQSDG